MTINITNGDCLELMKDIPDNSKVMGYPAKNIRQFLKENR